MTGQTISNYRILSQIGEGGMGVVYVAEDLRLGRRVAIKFPLTGGDEKHYRARFLREARAVSALNHKNIAAVYDYGETAEGQPYIVMELVTGQTLGDILLGEGLSLGRAVEIVGDVGEALAEAHRRGVVHRDIKPSNVLVNDRDEVKVLDFGLAKQLEEVFGAENQSDEERTLLATRTRSDVVIGTPLYLSPEQARGARVDGRSDLFALGALLYECIAGRPAFSGANVIEIGAQVLHVNPPPPSQFNSRVPPELDGVTLKALAKKPEERYQSADEMVAELEAARAKLPNADPMRTRRLAAHSNGHRSSALLTLSDTLRRPRLSPLAFVAALAIVLLGLRAMTLWRAPTAHKPLPAAAEAYERGMAAMREGAYYKASVALKEAVEIDDQFVLAHARLAEAWAEQDYIERATKELLTASTLVPDRKVLPSVDALYLDAITATVRRKYANAVGYYKEIAQRNPDQPYIELDLGRAYDKNDEIVPAIDSYTKAATRDPQSATAYLRLGTLYGRNRNYTSAVLAFERAEKIYATARNNEGRAELLFQRGNFFANYLGKSAEARSELQQALDLARAAGDRHQQVQTLLQLSAVLTKEGNGEQAQAYVREAIELAQGSNMSDLNARGNLMLATAYYQSGGYEEAEKYFNLALEQARRDGIRRIEAMVFTNRGSMRLKQNQTDEALELIKQARLYFDQAGYRTEAASCALLIARTMRQKGDYAGALQTFEEQLRLAEQSGDVQQVGNLHRECGAVLSLQERYTEALAHFKESEAIFKSLGNQLLTVYTLLAQSNALARLGRMPEARDRITQARAIVSRPESGNKELQTRISSIEAVIALDEQRFAEVIPLSRSLITVGAQYKDVVIEAKYMLGLALAHSGAAREGRMLCEESVREAQAVNDPWQISTSQLALAEVLLKSGDAPGALDAASSAQESFARAGRTESAWRAMVIAARACHLTGAQEKERECLSQAHGLLAQLERTWGAEAMSSYYLRPDVQQLRKHLGPLNVAGR